MKSRLRVALACAFVLACALSGEAWALCPNCLAQSPTFGSKLRLLGAFLLLPFLIALIALRQIRRHHRPQRQSERSERVQ